MGSGGKLFHGLLNAGTFGLLGSTSQAHAQNQALQAQMLAQQQALQVQQDAQQRALEEQQRANTRAEQEAEKASKGYANVAQRDSRDAKNKANITGGLIAKAKTSKETLGSADTLGVDADNEDWYS